MDVFGIFITVSFIGLIVTLVVMNIIERIKKAQEYKPYTPYSEYYVAEESKDLELASKVLSDKPKSEVVTKQKQPTQTVKTRLEVNPDRNISNNMSKSSSNTNPSYDTSLANPLNPTNVLLYASLLDDSNNSSGYNSCNSSSSSSYSDSSSSYSSSSSSDSSSSSCSSDSSSW